MRLDPGRPNAALRALLAAVCALALAPARAESVWYTVEVIVFQHLSENGLYAERWPLDPGRPVFADAIELSAPAELSLDEEEAALGLGAYAFRLLDPPELALGEVAGRLKRSRNYRPLLHVGWRQPGFGRGEAVKVRLHDRLPNRYGFRESAADGAAAGSVAVGGLSVEGTFQVSRARYLHVDVDMLHYRSRGGASGSATALPEPEVFRMTLSRRMRSREVHYLDHPLFGLLVLITPFEPPEL